MKSIFQIAMVAFLFMRCSEKPKSTEVSNSQIEFNQSLADELKRMAEIDQIAAFYQQGKYLELSKEEWEAFQDSVFTTHQRRLDAIFTEHGYPGYDLVGEEGSRNFRLMVQHSDANPDFQKEVLDKMKIEVEKGNADASDYGYLVDRVNINTGKAQVYGTQVSFNTEICKSFLLNLEDSVNVNKRRQKIGLKPLEIYLNEMTEMHFVMNKELYLSKGIKAPKLYEIEGG